MNESTNETKNKSSGTGLRGRWSRILFVWQELTRARKVVAVAALFVVLPVSTLILINVDGNQTDTEINNVDGNQTDTEINNVDGNQTNVGGNLIIEQNFYDGGSESDKPSLGTDIDPDLNASTDPQVPAESGANLRIQEEYDSTFCGINSTSEISRPGTGVHTESVSQVYLAMGGYGPKTANELRYPRCDPDYNTAVLCDQWVGDELNCRYLYFELVEVEAGKYRVDCIHDGYREGDAPGVPGQKWRDFNIEVEASGNFKSEGPCYITFDYLTGQGVRIAVSKLSEDGKGLENPSVALTSDWLRLY